ncbi:putative DNA helicase MCM8 [Diplonema papillatum]|nr:putative DNA helicase MCM8 [Diplonema papillatum]
MAGIRAIAARPDAFALLVHSRCPIIVGHDLVKAGMLLTLFGGTPRSPESGQRGDTHMLVVGDPGAGKSQMLRAVSHVAPRGVLVSGNSASASGLTVTLVRDVATGDTALEAGALVLGDQGTTCIDEFDKMDKTEHQALLEAMEQQRISIAKAGAVGSLPARTSVIAAANPTSGHYDDLKSVAENVRTNPALLSRFDLVFIVKDTIGGIQQEGLTKHVLSLHAGRRNPDPPRPPAAAAAGAKEEVLSYTSEGMESRLLSRKYSDAELVPHKLITKYLTTKRTVRPTRSGPCGRVCRRKRRSSCTTTSSSFGS